jgi:hypothetical protein
LFERAHVIVHRHQQLFIAAAVRHDLVHMPVNADGQTGFLRVKRYMAIS